MLNSKIHETIKRISKIKLRSGEPRKMDDVLWVIKRYLYYAIEAAIHGYPIKVYCEDELAAIIQLVWQPYPKQKLLKRHIRRYAFSSRVFGKLFTLSITGKHIPKKYYRFFMEGNTKIRMENILNTDAIYQFIRE